MCFPSQTWNFLRDSLNLFMFLSISTFKELEIPIYGATTTCQSLSTVRSSEVFFCKFQYKYSFWVMPRILRSCWLVLKCPKLNFQILFLLVLRLSMPWTNGLDLPLMFIKEHLLKSLHPIINIITFAGGYLNGITFMYFFWCWFPSLSLPNLPNHKYSSNLFLVGLIHSA